MEYKEVKNKLYAFGYLLLSKEYKNNKQNLELQQKDGYKYVSTYNHIVRGYKPLKFGNSNKFTLYNINLWLKLKGSNTVATSLHKINNRIYINAICSCGNKYNCSLSNFLNKQYKQCKTCGIKSRADKLKTSFKELNKIADKNNYKFLNKNKFSIKGRYPFINKDGYIVITSIDAMKRNFGANKFDISNPYTIHNIKNFIKINNINCELISTQYFGKEYPLEFKCECGDKFISTWHYFMSDSARCCPKCWSKTSSGEEKVNNLLSNLKINFIYQYSFDDCKYKNLLSFDFYLPSYNACIEVNGIQHYEPIEFFGGEKGFIYQQKRDKIKKDYCKLNDINLIEISYKDLKNEKYKNKIINKVNLDK